MKVIIHRKRRFAAAWVAYWVMTGIDREDFVRRMWSSDCQNEDGNEFITIKELDEQGARIKNGQTITLELEGENVPAFVVSVNGTVSDAVSLCSKDGSVRCAIDTKGGWSKLPYPCISVEQ